MRLQLFPALAAALLLAGCGTYSTGSVERPVASAPAARAATQPAQITVTENDVPNRPYDVLGDVEVTVRKVTIFDKDPTPALAAEALKEKAAELGADAVVLTRYGTVGMGLFSWGQIEAKGRAIAFKR